MTTVSAPCPVNVCCIGGTWSWRSAWWQDGSDLFAYWSHFGLTPLRVDGRPFRWTGDLGASWKFWKGDEDRVLEWIAFGDSLMSYAHCLPSDQLVIVAHSHGGQIPILAAANGLKIARLLTIATPVRADLADEVAAGRPNIGHWMHVCDSKGDKTAWWGAFGDRQWGNTREFPESDSVVRLPGIGHSGLVSDPKQFHHWQSAGLIKFLKGEL